MSLYQTKSTLGIDLHDESVEMHDIMLLDAECSKRPDFEPFTWSKCSRSNEIYNRRLKPRNQLTLQKCVAAIFPRIFNTPNRLHSKISSVQENFVMFGTELSFHALSELLCGTLDPADQTLTLMADPAGQQPDYELSSRISMRMIMTVLLKQKLIGISESLIRYSGALAILVLVL